MNSELKQQMIKEVNEIFDSREPNVSEIYPLVREIYLNLYGWPEIDTLRHEVCLCLIFGLYQAAITLTNHMLESFLKFALSYKHSFDNHLGEIKGSCLKSLLDSLKPGFELYDGKDLGYTINRACKVGLISKEQKKQLHEFRESFRNAYSHAEKRKIHENREIPAQLANLSEGGELTSTPESVHKIFEMPFLHGLTQCYHAKANAPSYFLCIDAIVRETMPKLFKNTESTPDDGA